MNNIIIDSKSGYSGAGRSVHKKYANKNLYESLSAYGVGFHRHNSEIQQELNNYSKKNIKFTFTPHLIPMFRGILSTIYLDLNKSVNIKAIENDVFLITPHKQVMDYIKMKSTQPDTWISAMQNLQSQFIDGISAAAPEDYNISQEDE